jgi:tetratricopeptide (TPR) repeat protein
MAFDPYGPCPCGSGKKFKWCCQPIHVEIDKAFRQDEEGQHESALRIMEAVVAGHPDNPEAWGRQAQILYQNDQVESAEKALDKALELNPNYPFGHFLRGSFRQYEGEIPGALVEFRKAAELYDSSARDILAQLYVSIAQNELTLNHPVAARAAFEIGRRFRPTDENLKEVFQSLFVKESGLPEAASREYSYLPPPATSNGLRVSWDKALSGAITGKLTDALQAFEKLTQDHPDLPAARYNLGLTRAWLGDNPGAVEDLDRYVTLEPDEKLAAAAWELALVLHYGFGMEDRGDWQEHGVIYQLRDPQAFAAVIDDWVKKFRLVALQPDEEQKYVTGILTDRQTTLVSPTEGLQFANYGGSFLMAGSMVRLAGPNPDTLQRLRADFEKAMGPALGEPQTTKGFAPFRSLLIEALPIPIPPTEEANSGDVIREKVNKFFEEKLIHRPMPTLGNVSPLDAAGHPILRKKLVGLLGFLKGCLPPVEPFKYDFDRLRRKLGLQPAVAGALGEPGDVSQGSKEEEVSSMGAPELSTLKLEDLSDDHLEKAYQAALKLDAKELAGHFARALISRPQRTDRPDRFPWYTHLMQLALSEGDTETALNYVNEGERLDCEHNQGHRRNDYELRRAQIHSKRGEADRAHEIFSNLISRVPAELRFHGNAAEAMLSARQPARALQFAEGGLAKARQQNNRDSEQYFLELVEAAKRKQ